MKRSVCIVLKSVGIFFASIIGLLLIAIVVFSIAEYRPKNTENITLNSTAKNDVLENIEFKILTWNTGYAALSDNADFFMDGGTMVTTCTKDQVTHNMQEVYSKIESENADFVFLQEIDIKSKRTYFINQVQDFANRAKDYQSSFANNFKVLYFPYPFYDTMGSTNSGIMTLSKYTQSSSTRVQLPCPFKWPVRLFNLKRCLMINRIPLKNSSKELVLINLHLEAFDDGEGKILQTKMLNQVFSQEVDKGNYVIAGGDFNQSFSNIDISAYPIVDKNYWQPSRIDIKDFNSTAQFIMDNSSPSGRSLDKAYNHNKDNFQFYLIDGFIVSSNINVTSVKTKDYDFINSDHNPVVMTFTLKTED